VTFQRVAALQGHRFELFRTESLNHDTARLTKLVQDPAGWEDERGGEPRRRMEEDRGRRVSLDERWPSLVKYL
jgi:hypothetical protein